MKRRLITALTILVVLFSAYTVSRIIIPAKYYGLIDMLSLAVLIFDAIYLWFGLSRLVVYFTYGIFMIPSLFFFSPKYQLLLIFIFTVIIVLNPLAGLENFLDNNLKEIYTKTFDYQPPGRYKTYYKYRYEMKNHYHMPQTQKFYTRPIYRFLRTITLLLLFFSIVFLLLFSSSDIVIGIGWNTRSFVTLYMAGMFTIALLILYKKGFSSMLRVFKIGVFPPIIIILSITSFNLVAKIITLSALSAAFLGIITNEILTYYKRVVYSSYHYFDPKTNEKVWANALYEQFIYSGAKRKNVSLKFKLPEELFHKQFDTLLIRTNFLRTIITAYTARRGNITVYLEAYKESTIKKVKKSLKNIYNVDVIEETVIDEAFYEKKFLHNHEYIIARAIKLSNLLIELNIENRVIISVSMHFKTVEQVNPLAKKYQTKLLEKEDDYCLVESSITVDNLDYLIETNLRNLLLEMLINGGTFVRVMVYY